MASIVLGVAGSVVGGYFGGPIGAQIGGTIGSLIGGLIDGSATQKGPHREGPRLNDLTVQTATYGQPKALVYGAMRIAGNVIDGATKLEEVGTTTTTSTSSSSSGKGGSSSSTSSTTTFSYFSTFAAGICAGPIVGVRRIWADGKLIWDKSTGSVVSKFSGVITIYVGDETQLPDPTLEAMHGAGNVPAYRGTAYVMFNRLPLADFGNRIPNVSFEVARPPTFAPPLGVHFDGSTIVKNAAIAAPDSTSCSWVYWFRAAGASNANHYTVFDEMSFNQFMFSNDFNSPFPPGNDFGFKVGTADLSSALAASTDTAFPTAGVWTCAMISIDTNHASGARVWQIALGDAVATSSAFVDSGIAFTLSPNGFPMLVGGADDGNPDDNLTGDMAEFWWAPGEFIDFTVTANRRKFVDAAGAPVDLGSNGSTPTGSAPAVYLSRRDGDPPSSFATNRGTGGDFTVSSGSLTASSTPPHL